MIERAKEIIFSMEGNYGSVAQNDNGALSIGCVQWHGNRAKELLKKIYLETLDKEPDTLPYELKAEIVSHKDWSTRVISTDEKFYISRFITTPSGKRIQDEQSSADIMLYFTHIKDMGFMDEETIIFLADIENQGGLGASRRIGLKAIELYGKDATLEEVFKTACEDVVFKNYIPRRKKVYNMLVSPLKLDEDGIMGVKTIKALQRFLKIGETGVMDKQTVKALQIFLNRQV